MSDNAPVETGHGEKSQRTSDLYFDPLPNLSWSADERLKSLDAVYDYVLKDANKATVWYLKRKKGKRRCAQWLRVLAILLGVAAGLLPLFDQISGWISGWMSSSGILPSILLGIAGALILYDRFFGCSSSWMRFLETELQIRKEAARFQLDWHESKAGWQNGSPDESKTQELVKLAATFHDKLHELLEQEMSDWIREFRSVIGQIDASAKLRTGK